MLTGKGGRDFGRGNGAGKGRFLACSRDTSRGTPMQCDVRQGAAAKAAGWRAPVGVLLSHGIFSCLGSKRIFESENRKEHGFNYLLSLLQPPPSGGESRLDFISCPHTAAPAPSNEKLFSPPQMKRASKVHRLVLCALLLTLAPGGITKDPYDVPGNECA